MTPARDREPLRVWSFNVRGPFDEPPLDWAHRRDAARQLLAAERPHIIGTQETMFDVAQDIASWCYDWVGLGRDGGSRGEHMAIFYDPRRLAPTALDHVWLSDTPHVIGSCTWPGQACVRMLTWVRFTDRQDGRALFVLNTHLDHVSDEARERSARLILDVVDAEATGLPVVVTGDFNDVPGSVAHRTLTARLTDAFDGAPDQGIPTFHGYGTHEPCEVIDWVLTRDCHVSDSHLVLPPEPGRFASDHHPLSVTIG